MARLRDLPHITLDVEPLAPRYTSPLAGGGGTRTKPQDRQTHGEQLRRELLSATQDNPEDHALRLVFESEPDFDLHLRTLDPSGGHGIVLLNVRPQGTVTEATVLVERGHFGKFLRIFEDYLTKTRGPKGNPANKTFVESIAHVRRASVKSLWTELVEPFPAGADAFWWEAWIRRTDGSLAQFRAAAAQRRIELSKYALTFIDRYVVNLRATSHQLSELLEEDDLLAELRHPKLSTAELMQLTPKEQRAWASNLLERLQLAPAGAPVVCLLDTGVANGHELLIGSLPSSSCHAVEPGWGSDDQHGHGTQMAGLALLGDLTKPLSSTQSIRLAHALESVKLIPIPGDVHNKESYGAVTQEAIARAEEAAPRVVRIICLSVTSTDGREQGRPTSWSAALDESAFGALDGPRRLICVAAGDAGSESFSRYPTSNYEDSVHDPGQAWNALTVGAYSDRDAIIEPDLSQWRPVASVGDLCPSSTTSVTWGDTWPIKPEIVLEGGNAAFDPSGRIDFPDSLSLLTTYHQPLVRPFTTTGETSAAVALAARIAARLQARYPHLWPETLRALLIHSTQWTVRMHERLGAGRKAKRAELRNLLRVFGYGVPNEEETFASASDCLTLIKQAELQPYDRSESRPVTRDMHLYDLPWPTEALRALGDREVELRVTLSYFVQPLPGERGYGQNQRHRYASHGLRFEVKTGVETPEQFGKRINKAMREEQEAATSGSDSSMWEFGPDLRSAGSLHHDRWRGPAAELAAKAAVAVFPVVGWWRERPRFGRLTAKARYALVVSIRTPGIETDIYTPVAQLIGLPVPVVIPAT